MDTLSTPKSAMSSVFFTPPFSSEKNYFETTGSLATKFPLPEFLSLTPQLAVDEEDKCDILSLLSDSFLHISYSILSHLKPSDLNNSVAVCKTWRRVVLSKNSFVDIIVNFRKELKKQQENLYMKQLLTTSPPHTPRLPLNTLTFNSIPDNTICTVLKAIELKPANERWRPCPQCSSPARIHQTQSHCDICEFKFCSKCFKPSHIDQKCSITTSPKKRQGNIAGNSRSKKRLRRL